MDSEVLRYRLETIKDQAEALKFKPSDSQVIVEFILSNVEALLVEIDDNTLDELDEFF